MWISKRRYDRLKTCEEMVDELEKEVKRLEDIISAEVKDCKVGIWCKDCQHMECDHSETYGYIMNSPYVNATAGEVQYCKKHLHEICPEFEKT